MKITFLEEATNLGGARIATVDLVANLNQIPDIEADIVDISGSCTQFLNYACDKGVVVKVLKPDNKALIIRSNSVYQRLQNSIKLFFRIFNIRSLLAAYIRDEKPDFIIVNGYRRLLYLSGLKSKSQICFYAHGWYISQQISRFQKFLLRNITSKIICISEATKQAMFSNRILPLKDLYVVHNGIDIPNLNSSVATIPNSEKKFKILHCGGFTEGKSQLISLEIAKELKDRGVNFLLIFAGIIYKQQESKSYYDKVLKRIDELDLNEHVHLVVGHSNVIDYFRASDILIHPSETEGLPLVVMEAMALKKPVVANGVGGVTDYILNGFTGFIPQHDSVTDYADIIERLSKDRTLYAYVANNAYELVSKQYTVQNQIRDFLKIVKA